MLRDDCFKSSAIHCVTFNELKDPRLILGASGLQCDGCKVLGPQDPCRFAVNVSFDSVLQCFFKKRSACGQKLNWPTTDNNVLAFHLAAELLEVVEYRRGRNKH